MSSLHRHDFFLLLVMSILFLPFHLFLSDLPSPATSLRAATPLGPLLVFSSDSFFCPGDRARPVYLIFLLPDDPSPTYLKLPYTSVRRSGPLGGLDFVKEGLRRSGCHPPLEGDGS